MPALIEYDCSRSTAIEKLALNREKNEVVVVYRQNAAIYLYYGSVALESIILADASLGKAVAEIKTLSNFRKISSFPKQTVLYHGHVVQSTPVGTLANNQSNHNQPKTNLAPIGPPKTNPNPTPIAPPKSNMLIDALLNKARSRHNYSHEWKMVLENNINALTLDQLEGLILILKKCDPLQPPHKKPTIPPVNEKMAADNNHTTASTTKNTPGGSTQTSGGFRSANVIAFAFDDEEDDDDEDDDGSDLSDDDEGTATMDSSIGPLSQTTMASVNTSVVASGLLAGLPIPPLHDR